MNANFQSRKPVDYSSLLNGTAGSGQSSGGMDILQMMRQSNSNADEGNGSSSSGA
jgi:hypothetical protein